MILMTDIIVDMSIKTEVCSPHSLANYWVWTYFYMPKNWVFRIKLIWALDILGLHLFGLGSVQKSGTLYFSFIIIILVNQTIIFLT